MIKIFFALVISVKVFCFTICFEDQVYLPFIDGQKGSIDRGILHDIISKALVNLSIEHTFISMPWKRCLKGLEEGKVDAAFAAIWNEKREKWSAFPMADDKLDHTRSLWTAQYKVFTHKDSSLKFKNNAFENINYGIDSPPGYISLGMLKEMKVNSTKNHVPEKGFELVRLKRLDGYVIEENIGRNIALKIKASQDLIALDEIFYEASWFMPIGKKFYKTNKILSEKIWTEIAKVKNLDKDLLIKKYSKN